MRVLVVGGYGFIGRAVAEALQRHGHDVVGWGRQSSPTSDAVDQAAAT